jgi:hypothetical protein
MSKVAVLQRELAVPIPQGFPEARVSALRRRTRETIAGLQDRGELVGAVETSPDGTVRALTVAGLLAAAERE